MGLMGVDCICHEMGMNRYRGELCLCKYASHLRLVLLIYGGDQIMILLCVNFKLIEVFTSHKLDIIWRLKTSWLQNWCTELAVCSPYIMCTNRKCYLWYCIA